MHRRPALVLASAGLVVAMLSGTAPAHASSTSSNVVHGIVTDGGKPAADVEVGLVRLDRAQHSCSMSCSWAGRYAHTDRYGNYAIRSVDDGTYAVAANAWDVDHATSYHGGQSQFETAGTVRVAGGTTVSGVDIALTPAASISGRVLAGDANAAHGLVDVRLWSQYGGKWHVQQDAAYADPQVHPGTVDASGPSAADTFEMRRVAAGTYKLEIVPSSADAAGVRAAWWGGTSLTTAKPITIRAGEHLTGQDVSVSTLDRSAIDTSVRVTGPDRWSVSVAIAQRGVAEGIYRSGQTVFLTSGDVFPDALSAAPAAAAHHYPVLLTGGTTLPEVVRSELVALAPSRVVVIGGSVSSAVIDRVRAAVPRAAIAHVTGRDRYEVSQRVDDAFFPGSRPVVTFASGTDYHYPLAAAAADGIDDQPLVPLRPGTRPDAATIAFLQRHGADQFFFVGSQQGTGPDYQVYLPTHSGSAVLGRGGSVDPSAVSAAVAEQMVGTSRTVFLVTSEDFPDALAAAALAADEHAPLLETRSDCLTADAAAAIAFLGAEKVVRVGGSLSSGMARLPLCH